MSAPQSSGYQGRQGPGDGSSEYNAQVFLIQSLIRRIATATLVKVMAVTNAGAVDAVGFVDILPLVNQLDGAGNAVPHVTIYRCPYFRLQGGANAVILDPQVGDIGIALFADKDISSVTANRGPANPGSRRRFDMADGLYLGGVLNGIPTQYVQFSAAGVKIHSPVAVVLDAPDVRIACTTMEVSASSSVTITTPTLTINGATQANGSVTATGTITAPTVAGTTDVTAAGKSGASHHHLEHDGYPTGSPA
jgi:hypothetical protein